MKSKKLYIIIFLSLTLISCSQVDNIKKLFGVRYEVADNLTKTPPKVVAILPFENLTENPEASIILRRSFYSQFSPKSFIDIEIPKIDSDLKKNHINNPIDLRKFDSKFLGEMLHADALIYGRVSNYKKAWRLFYSYRTVSLSTEMLDARTGEILWMADRKMTNYGGDIPGTTYTNPFNVMTSLAIGPVKAFWDYFFRDIEYTRTANELCREIVETIPEP